jgi:hypothetical protein
VYLLHKVLSHFHSLWAATETYIECTFNPLLHMQSVYFKLCKENNASAASRTSFREIVIEEKNASTYHRRIGATFAVGMWLVQFRKACIILIS